MSKIHKTSHTLHFPDIHGVKNSDSYHIHLRKIGDGKLTDFALERVELYPLATTGFPFPSAFLFLPPTKRAGNLMVRYTWWQLPDGNGFDHVEPKPKRQRDDTLRDDTCGRDYPDRHFDRVTRLAGSDYNYQSRPYTENTWYSFEKCENATPSLPLSFFSSVAKEIAIGF